MNATIPFPASAAGFAGASNDLQSELSRAEFLAHQVKALVLALNVLADDSESQSCMTAIIERLYQISVDALDGFDRLDSRLCELLRARNLELAFDDKLLAR